MADLSGVARAIPRRNRPFHLESGRRKDGRSRPLALSQPVCLGIGSGAAGFRRSNLIGQRVYHWINYPRQDARTRVVSDERADRQNGGQSCHDLDSAPSLDARRGSNGDPHADYRVARDEEAMRRTIAHAHPRACGWHCIVAASSDIVWMQSSSRGIAGAIGTGFTSIGTVRSASRITSTSNRRMPQWATPFFRATAVACLPEIISSSSAGCEKSSGRADFSSGTRDSGRRAFCRTCCATPICRAKRRLDRAHVRRRDQAVYGGMMGGGVCHPWTLDSPAFCQSRRHRQDGRLGILSARGSGHAACRRQLRFPARSRREGQ